ncbi:MAG: hypothetical protein JWM11_816 [Planctomycetaceae bacterium]|nr:hypothetical protein [Planctomycetaceae bacterium]
MAMRICLLLALVLLAGCQEVRNRMPWVQFPTLAPRSPAAERESYSQHDPLPDDSLGPSVSGRPREALIQRGEPRRVLEASVPTAFQNGGSSTQQQPLSEYPQTVVP